MAKVLLIDPSGARAQDQTVRKQRPNIGLAYIAAALLERKNKVKVIDLNILDENDLTDLLLEWSPDITGISAMTFNIIEAYEIAQFIRNTNKNTKIVLGGVHVTALPERTLEESENIDIGVVGEGEETICEIAEGKDCKDIKGIVFRSNGKITRNEPRQLLNDLNCLPFPAWHLFDLGKYRRIHSRRLKTNLNELIVIGSRGCPERCAFCFRTGGNRIVRFRSAESVINEIIYNFKTFGIRFYHMGDSSLMMKQSFFEKFCQLLIDNNLTEELTWVCEARPNEVDKEKTDLLKRAGCEYLYLGIESGSQKMLDLMKKGTTKEQIKTAVQAAHYSDLAVGGNFLFGFPGETRSTMEESIQFALELNLNGVEFNILDLYPGTELWEKAEKDDMEEWSIAGDLYEWDKRTRRNSHILLHNLSNNELEYYREKAEKMVRKQQYIKHRGWLSYINYRIITIGGVILRKIGLYNFVKSRLDRIIK